ncbi:MAG: hypothetical protein ACRDJM_05415 [Actinomycetota bacterium]
MAARAFAPLRTPRLIRALMRTRLAVGLVAALALPAAAGATVDAACGTNVTSAVVGTIRNVKGDALSQIHVQLRQANKSDPVIAQTFTDAAGNYRLCVGHDTYDVRAFDDLGGVYATANRQATTFTEILTRTDFTLEYKLNLSITPQAVSIPNPGNSTLVSWIIRSKAPCALPNPCTDMQLTLEHVPGVTLHPAFLTTEAGGPSAGGWNVWRQQMSLANPLPERAYFATASGRALNNSGQTVRTTEFAHDPYLVDNRAPVFGPLSTPGTDCGGSQIAGPFSPSVTTNPSAQINVGVCDPYSNGGRSSLDPYSVDVDVFDVFMNPISGGGFALNQLSIMYLPGSPFAPGTYRFRYTIRDNAGNQSTSGLYTLQVTTSGGSVPAISGVQPGNLGENPPAMGIVAGSNLTTPSSRPVVAFQARDADGQLDLSAGSLRVRIYGPDGHTLVYDYDPSSAPCDPNAPSCPANSGFFNQGTGRFDASGFSLVGKPPGLYVATASITDHGGNATTRTWRWVLLAAT